MLKLICFIISVVLLRIIWTGSENGVPWCETAMEWFIYSLVWGLFVLVVLKIIIIILSMFQ